VKRYQCLDSAIVVNAVMPFFFSEPFLKINVWPGSATPVLCCECLLLCFSIFYNDELRGVDNCGAKRSSFPRPSPTTCYAFFLWFYID